MTREEAINHGKEQLEIFGGEHKKFIEMAIEALSTDIVRCKDCRKHNQGINEAPYLADRCPLIIHRGYAKGHEFDYQFCVYGERREDG